MTAHASAERELFGELMEVPLCGRSHWDELVPTLESDCWECRSIAGLDTELVFDDWARQHLADWYRHGSAPNDWDLAVYERFVGWVEQHASDYPHHVDWPTMARDFDRTRETR